MARSEALERRRAAAAKRYAEHKDERKAKQRQYYIEHKEELRKRQMERKQHEREVELPQLCKRFSGACDAIKSAVREEEARRGEVQVRTWAFVNVDGRFVFQSLLTTKHTETLHDVNSS